MMIGIKALSVAVVCSLALLPSAARADGVPNFKKRGDLEKRFVSEVCVAIIKAARTSAKNPSLQRFEYKEVKDKPGRTELHIKGKFSGLVTGSDYTADMVVHIDTRDKNSWEVLRIDYEDNSKNVLGYNRKNVANLVKKFNGD
jgi:hypothetical protein